MAYCNNHKSIGTHCLIVTSGLYLFQQIVYRTLQNVDLIGFICILDSTNRDILDRQNGTTATAGFSLYCDSLHSTGKFKRMDLDRMNSIFNKQEGGKWCIYEDWVAPGW